MLKKHQIFLSGIALLAFGLLATGIAQDKKPLSPPAETSVTINGKQIKIAYSAPSMRGRKIFGELEGFNRVWRTGANGATALKTDADLNIGGVKVPKGNYTLFTYLAADQWQLIVNKQTGQSGLEYDEKQDVGRVKMAMSKPSAPVEAFKITLASAGGKKGTLTMAWENTVAAVAFTVE